MTYGTYFILRNYLFHALKLFSRFINEDIGIIIKTLIMQKRLNLFFCCKKIVFFTAKFLFMLTILDLLI